jgi:hypothetical protein
VEYIFYEKGARLFAKAPALDRGNVFPLLQAAALCGSSPLMNFYEIIA